MRSAPSLLISLGLLSSRSCSGFQSAHHGRSSLTPTSITSCSRCHRLGQSRRNVGPLRMAATGERITVEQEDGNAPIDWLLSRKLPHRSRRFFRKQLADGNVQIDGRVNKRLVRVRPGQTITVSAAATNAVAPPSEQLPAQDLKLHVVYEDEHIIAVAKPPGIVVQPMASQPRGTLLNGVLHHMVARGEVAAGDEVAAQGLLQGVVHRLDRDTSGIVIVAKNLEASSTLSAMFKSRKVSKTYLAVTAGLPNPARCAPEPAAAAAAAAGAAAGVRGAAAAAGGRGVRASAAAAAVSSGGARPSADGAAASKRTRASVPGALKMAKPKVRVKDAAAALNLAKLAQNAIGSPSDK
eukprot:TRINITY_DN5836_c0_g1_i1.p1 TRINITY_DN5836_c0_g1~~TRINITY_DN5836_c0_g1_i1.p1  ORF type:complete len:352 (+),score=82.69 TRINITY_DN5836_c0_g1_i1:166-1221(+)